MFQGRGDDPAGRDDIIGFLAECRQRNLLAADEHTMLLGALEVSQTHVREIMVPRSHMVVLPEDEPFDELLKIIVESGHSRFPVIGHDRDEVDAAPRTPHWASQLAIQHRVPIRVVAVVAQPKVTP